MRQRTLEVMSAVGLVAFLLCICMTMRCASTPAQVSSSLAEIAYDGTLDSVPEQPKQRIIKTLEMADKAVAIAQEKAQDEAKWAVVGKTLTSVGIALLSLLVMFGAVWAKYHFSRR